MTDTDPRCAKCGKRRSKHNYRHPFIGPSRDATTRDMSADLVERLWKTYGNYARTGLDRFAAMQAKECAERIAELEAERDEAMRQGLYLAKYLHQKHYSEVTNWEPLDDPAGVISQIDNMIAGMSARIAELEAERSATLGQIKGETP